MIQGVYGVNIAVKDLDNGIKTYERLLGIKPTRILAEKDFAFPGLKGVAFDLGGIKIHLIASVAENTSIAKFIEARGEGIFLLSLRSSDVAEDTQQMRDDGTVFVLKEPIRGEFGCTNFIHPKLAHGVQIEIFEPGEKW